MKNLSLEYNNSIVNSLVGEMLLFFLHDYLDGLAVHVMYRMFQKQYTQCNVKKYSLHYSLGIDVCRTQMEGFVTHVEMFEMFTVNI